MANVSTVTADVFSAEEIARAADKPARAARELIAAGRIRTLDGTLVARREAIRAVRLLRGGSVRRELFEPPAPALRSGGRALAASGALHAAIVGVLALLTTLSVASAPETMEPVKQTRLVFIATPGPGGGGGGGGLRQPAPPRRAEMKGLGSLRSPVPPPKRLTTRKPEPRLVPPPVRPKPVEQPLEPPPPAPRPEPMPQVVAPVVTASADTQDRAGTLTDSGPDTSSQGPGSGGGAGTGTGTGVGEGDGAGIGPGSGGGTGGGPYRPGSGITPPQLLREVKPEYTQEARRRSVEGDVVLEIIVRRDGTVGEVRLLHGLGAGLDQRAVEAVRQWRFSPARRYGTPVDVIVEVSVEFKLR